MHRLLKIAMIALALVAFTVPFVQAKGGTSGGGSVKPVTVRLAGYITAMQPVVGGVKVTLE